MLGWTAEGRRELTPAAQEIQNDAKGAKDGQRKRRKRYITTQARDQERISPRRKERKGGGIKPICSIASFGDACVKKDWALGEGVGGVAGGGRIGLVEGRGGMG